MKLIFCCYRVPFLRKLILQHHRKSNFDVCFNKFYEISSNKDLTGLQKKNKHLQIKKLKNLISWYGPLDPDNFSFHFRIKIFFCLTSKLISKPRKTFICVNPDLRLSWFREIPVISTTKKLESKTISEWIPREIFVRIQL